MLQGQQVAGSDVHMYQDSVTHQALLLRLLNFSLIKVSQYPFTVYNLLYI